MHFNYHGSCPTPSRPRVLLLLALASLHHRLAQCSPTWKPITYPMLAWNPIRAREVEACWQRGQHGWVCDPDGVLSSLDVNVAESFLTAIIVDSKAHDSMLSAPMWGMRMYVHAECGGTGQGRTFQV